MNKKNICVIGAGLSGLVTIKELLEKGHTVTCFEASSKIGGVFSNAKTYDSVLLTVSNYFMSYSDFMPTEERLKYWTKQDYFKYLGRYAEHFKLLDAVKFETPVVSLKRQDANWEVNVKQGNEEQSYVFDSVAVCSGQFQKVNIPKLKGMENFKGEILHSTEYTNAEKFAGKNVMCIGLGESSTDVTTEISEVANKTVLSLRRYPMVAPRYVIARDNTSYNPYYPVDVFTTCRAFNELPRDVHTKITQGLFKTYTNSYDPAVRLRGKWNLSSGAECQQVIMKNERVFNAIVDGDVEVNASGIKGLSETSVIFNDGAEEEVDSIVCCTGFRFSIPFSNIQIEDPRQLYKNMFHPDYDESLAMIGFVRPQQGGVPALAELQARYFSLLCSGEKQLPAPDHIREQAKKDEMRWKDEFSLTPQVTSLVNFVHYAEDIARCIGCEFQIDPKKEPELFKKCFEGPLWPAQFRLNGPGAKPEQARKILLGAPIPYHRPWLLKKYFSLLLWLRRNLAKSDSEKPRYA